MKTTTLSPQSGFVPGFTPSSRLGGAERLTAQELASLAFFAGLETIDLEQIADHTKISQFAPGEMIVSQGDPADRFYVLLAGSAAIECNLPDVRLQVDKIGPGDAVGFSWLFTPEKVHFTARATEPVTAVFVYGTLLRDDCEHIPHLGYELAKRAGQTMLKRLESLVALIGGERRA